MAAGDNQAELENPEVFEAAVVEKHKTQEGNKEGHEDRNQVLQNCLVPTQTHTQSFRYTHQIKSSHGDFL